MTTILIKDIGTTAIYELTGTTLEMVEDGQCSDALNGNGCKVSESMTDDRISEAVRRSWLIGYEGGEEAAEDNGLEVVVERD